MCLNTCSKTHLWYIWGMWLAHACSIKALFVFSHYKSALISQRQTGFTYRHLMRALSIRMSHASRLWGENACDFEVNRLLFVFWAILCLYHLPFVYTHNPLPKSFLFILCFTSTLFLPCPVPFISNQSIYFTLYLNPIYTIYFPLSMPFTFTYTSTIPFVLNLNPVNTFYLYPWPCTLPVHFFLCLYSFYIFCPYCLFIPFTIHCTL